MVHIGGTIIMHVFSGVLDEEFLVELPPKSVLEHTIFKIFLGGMPPDSLAICMLIVLHTT